MFNFFKRKPAGEIKYFGLSDWWMSALTSSERDRVVSVFPSKGLLEGELTYCSGSITSLLGTLAGWFGEDGDRNIAYKMLKKAEESIAAARVLDRHFMFQSKIQTYYRFRDKDDFALSCAIEGCEQQIRMSEEAAKEFKKEYKNQPLPSHVGYDQLCIILEKQGKFEDAIKLAEKAKEQGWNGNWDSRVERLKKKEFKTKIVD